MSEQVPFHPLANIFPLSEGDDFEKLVADISAYGLNEPIVMHEDMVLDGRNRWLACQKAGIPICTRTFDGTDPLAFVLSANLHRRHLNESQRAMIAAKLANLPHGCRADRAANLPILPVTQSEAARLLNLSECSVRSAREVQERRVPELAGRVERGEIAVSLASKVAAMPKPKQAEVVALPERQLRGAVKQALRSEQEQALAEATRHASEQCGVKLYGVLYADPPWRFEPWSRETGMDRAADNHYPTMTVEEIKALGTKLPAAPDSVLVMWTTAPMLPAALAIMQAWGFEYKTEWIWSKNQLGTGYWLRNKYEPLLIGTRGNIPCPAPGDQPPLMHRRTARPAFGKTQHLRRLDCAHVPERTEARTLRPPRSARLGRVGQ